MISLGKIKTIAIYEARTLFRSWFFRIFLLISLLALIFINVALFMLPTTSRWMYFGIPSSIPYLNILLFSIIQSVICMIMASDFLKYDYKLDTTEVIYIRSMTNVDYVFGKVVGIFFVFTALNIIVLLIAFIFNYFFVETSLVPEVYLLYPLIISLPTIVFIIGLTFFVMILIKSQAVTFILLLSYCSIAILFLSQKLNHLFDFTGFYMPLMYSDFTGFSNFTEILSQRGIYFLFGAALIFAAALMLKRLPQSRTMNRVSFVLLILCAAGAISLGNNYITKINSGNDIRTTILDLKKEYENSPVVSIQSCSLDINHTGQLIEVTSKLEYSNQTAAGIDKLIFSLNPGLKISKITDKSGDLKFERDAHLISIQPVSPLKPGDTGSITIQYSGNINEDACYPAIDAELRIQSNRLSFYNLGKNYSFLTPEYVLLTPETNWYPKPGADGGNIYSGTNRMDFIKFDLKVKTKKSLQAISQGNIQETKPGEFEISPETPLPSISLVIGNYESKSITIDSVTYSLYIKKGHDYFSKYFDQIGEELEKTIKDSKANFENRLELKYPYNRFSIIETPIHFYAYRRYQTQSMETTLPEHVLLPEMAISLSNADFKTFLSFFGRMRGRGGDRGGRRFEMSPEQMQSMLLQRFIENTFLESGSQSMGNMMMQRMQQGTNTGRALNTISSQESSSDYSVFPLYYTYTRHFSSERWPMFNTVIEYYLIGKVEEQSNMFRRFFTDLSDQDRANFALTENSLKEILADPDLVENFNEIIKLKSSYLFSIIQGKKDTGDFEAFLKEYLDSIYLNDNPVEDFLDKFEERFGDNLEQHFDAWMNEKNLPAYVVSNLESYEILDNNQTRYQVFFDIKNIEPIDGMVKVEFRTRGGSRGGGGGRMGGGRMPFEPEGVKVIRLSGNQNKKVGIILDNQPFMMTINTFTSKNLPSMITMNFQNMELKENAIPFEGEIVLSIDEGTRKSSIIVDNEDPGFRIESQAKSSFLMNFLNRAAEDDEEYISMRFRNFPKKWKSTIGGNYYGTYRLSAHFIKAGKGNNKVSWNAQMPERGLYDVYFYLSGGRRGGFGMRGGRDRGGQQGRQRESTLQDFHFIINHDDGTEEITLDMSNAEDGWFLLGTFYFSKGRASVELTDESKGRMVVADAVRWTVRE
ncbi:hypothetical protein ACFL4T_06600 [candidate division KSB1 bacterium]